MDGIDKNVKKGNLVKRELCERPGGLAKCIGFGQHLVNIYLKISPCFPAVPLFSFCYGNRTNYLKYIWMSFSLVLPDVPWNQHLFGLRIQWGNPWGFKSPLSHQ